MVGIPTGHMSSWCIVFYVECTELVGIPGLSLARWSHTWWHQPILGYGLYPTDSPTATKFRLCSSLSGPASMSTRWHLLLLASLQQQPDAAVPGTNNRAIPTCIQKLYSHGNVPAEHAGLTLCTMDTFTEAWIKWPLFGREPFSNEISWIEIFIFSIRFHWNLFVHVGVQLTISGYWLTHWGWDEIAAISQIIFSYAFSWIELKPYNFRFRFHWSLFLRFQLTIFQHWFVFKVRVSNIPSLVQIMAWRRPGGKLLSEPMMGNSLTHIGVTRPQWVKAWLSNHRSWL